MTAASAPVLGAEPDTSGGATVGGFRVSGDDAPGTLVQRTRGLLEALRAIVPYDAAWLALSASCGSYYTSLSSVDLDDRALDYLSGSSMAHDIELTGTDRHSSPLSPSDLSYPAEELPEWSDCLLPSGIHEGLGVALFTPDGRHVGFLALFFGNRSRPSPAARQHLAAMAPLLADGIDPMRSLLTTAHLVRGATAGAAVHADGRTERLPGLGRDSLLDADSRLLTFAYERITEGRVHSSFLWRVVGAPPSEDLVQVTVISPPRDTSTALCGAVLLSPAPHLRGLTPRELEVLGLLIEGRSNQDIAHTLLVTPRTVAAHVEHLLVKLGASTRTLAAVRAERAGLYLPVQAAR